MLSQEYIRDRLIPIITKNKGILGVNDKQEEVIIFYPNDLYNLLDNFTTLKEELIRHHLKELKHCNCSAEIISDVVLNILDNIEFKLFKTFPKFPSSVVKPEIHDPLKDI